MEPTEDLGPVCTLTTAEVVDKVLVFIESFTDTKLYTYQRLFARRIVESVIDRDGAVVTGLWSRQSGKTETIADTSVGLAVILPVLAREFSGDSRFMPFKKGFRIGVYAPIQDQASLPFSRMREKTHSAHAQVFLTDPEIGVQVSQSRGDTLRFTNGSRIIAKSASPDSNIEGDTHNLVLVEEAQKVGRSKVEKDISPMLAATNGTMVKIGTAWISRGGFHTSIQHNVDTYEAGGKRNHFEFPYDIVISEKAKAFAEDKNPFHQNYESYVQNQIFRLGGVDGEEFKMNFRCLWHESRVIAINTEVFRQSGLDFEAGPRQFGFQVAGLDIGKVRDSTVLTIMEVDYASPVINRDTLPGADEERQTYYRKTILDWMELQGSFEGSSGQYQTLVNYLRQTRVQILCIDATSIGDPVYEHIESMIGGSITCIPFKFSLATKGQLYKYYLQELHARRIYHPAGHETQQRIEYSRFVQQHLDLDRQQYGSYVVCQAPEGGHDDYPDSAALACWAEKHAESVAMPEVVSSTNGSGFGRNRGRQVSSALPPRDPSNRAAVGGRASRYLRRW